MLNLPHSARPLQRTARYLLIGLCAVLATGFGVTVAGRLGDSSRKVVYFVDGDQATGEARATTADVASVSDRSVEVNHPLDGVVSVDTRPTALLAASLPQRELAGTQTILMEVTAYCACTKCCGPNARGITASGKRVTYNKGRFVAADTNVLPFGTNVSIPGYHGGEFVPVIDRGGAIKGNKLDLFFPTHQQALEWGRKMVLVTVAR